MTSAKDKSFLIYAFAALFAIGILAGCVPGSADISSFATPAPYTLAGLEYDAAAALSVAQTQQAEVQRRVIEATAAAEATQAAYSFQATATAGALAIAQAQREATSTAQAEYFRATQTAQAQALSFEATQRAAVATQTAIDLAVARAIEDAERSRELANFWNAFAPVASVSTLALFLTLAFWMATRYFNAWLEWVDMRRSVIETRSGTMVWLVNGSGELFPRLLEKIKTSRLPTEKFHDLPPVTQAQMSEAKAEPLTPSGSVWRSPIVRRTNGTNGDMSPERTSRALARWLVWQALQTAGPNSTQIPGWRQLDGWSAERWQRAVDVLKACGVVETQPRKGTYIAGGYKNLYELQAAIETRRLNLSPTSRVYTGGLGNR